MSPVQRRCVFYVSGFDPAGAARYHALYREEAAQQAVRGGLQVEVGPRRRLASRDSWWEIQAEEDQVHVHTRYEFLQWDTIVRKHWTLQRRRLTGDVLGASLFALRSGAFGRMFAAHRTATLVVALPLLMLAALFVAAPLAAALAGAAAWALTQSVAAAVMAAAGAAAAVLLVVRHQRQVYSSDWIGRSLAFTARQARGEVPELEQTLERHAARLAERLGEGVDDEVLVVGHSSGSLLAVSIVARALRQLGPRGVPGGTTLSLLTLGQCIPVLGGMPPATGFRAELRAVGSSGQVEWIDFSAPPDACCFPLVDPLLACGLERTASAVAGPKLLSPRFHQMFDPVEYELRRRDRFGLHFQYLMASHVLGPYDYFAITAGARTLGQRYPD